MNPSAPCLEAPRPPFSPWQRLYGGALRVRRAWYASRSRRLPVPVVSVGNLHLGGSGKTPLVAAIAAHLRDRGWRSAVLSRGYRRRGRGVRVVSTGDGPLLEPPVVGDEPRQLAEQLEGVAVVVGRDRYVAGLRALNELRPPPEVFVLDDGFSHVRLWRDLDLLTFPFWDPYGGGRLFPTGRLREPLSSVRHAHGVLLTGLDDGAGDGWGPALARSLRPYGFQGEGFASHTRVHTPKLGEAPLGAGSKVLLVAAVANPEQVAAAARRVGLEIVHHLRFPDHYRYPETSLRRIEAMWRRCEARAVVATAKDRVKLAGRLAVPLTELAIEANPEARFWEWLDANPALSR